VIVILQKKIWICNNTLGAFGCYPNLVARNSGVTRNMAHELAAKLLAGSGGKNELASHGEAAVP
jgi:hypothetical protein